MREESGSERKGRGVPPPAPLPEPETVSPEDVFGRVTSGECDLVCVLGPTASGKTRYAVALAREMNRLAGRQCVEIISADSRQLYKDLPIGTAAPTPEQLARVQHYMVGTLELSDYYSASQFETDVLSLLSLLYKYK